MHIVQDMHQFRKVNLLWTNQQGWSLEPAGLGIGQPNASGLMACNGTENNLPRGLYKVGASSGGRMHNR